MPNDDVDGMYWATDVPISMPVPPEHPVLIDMGAFGLTNFGIVHQINLADLENYVPSFLPGGSTEGTSPHG